MFHTTVGMHPSDVVFDEATTQAFVINEEGVSAVDLVDGATAGLPPIYELFDTLTVDPDTVEYTIVPDGSLAIGRRDTSNQVVFAFLDPSVELRTYNLTATPTDVDIAPDGSFGMFVIRALGQVAFFDSVFTLLYTKLMGAVKHFGVSIALWRFKFVAGQF